MYILNDSMISGARYHRVATYSVMKPASLPSGFVERVLRASPKSATLRSQLAFRSRFAGFRSRWTMSALCIVLSARSVWYTKYCTCAIRYPNGIAARRSAFRETCDEGRSVHGRWRNGTTGRAQGRISEMAVQ